MWRREGNPSSRPTLSVPKALREKYDRPSPSTDTLFKADKDHVHGHDRSCCLVTWKQRTQRASTVPVVHYGTIASGNGKRENSPNDRGLCLEMEAAGLMTNFLVLLSEGFATIRTRIRMKPDSAMRPWLRRLMRRNCCNMFPE